MNTHLHPTTLLHTLPLAAAWIDDTGDLHPNAAYEEQLSPDNAPVLRSSGAGRTKAVLLDRQGHARLCRLNSGVPQPSGRLVVVEDLEEFLHDPLTGLRDRRALHHDARVGSAVASVLVLDINGFKVVNDTRGHAAGDDVLRVMGQVLGCAEITEAVSAYRVGGDEFLLVSATHIHPAQVSRVQRAFAQQVREQTGLGGCTVACGLAHAPQHGETLCDLMRAADVLMYREKHAGRIGRSLDQALCARTWRQALAF